MRILVTGAAGQLGRALQVALEGHDITAAQRPDFELTDRASVVRAVMVALPELVIHGAAMTDVDGCERDPETAHQVNSLGTGHVANAAAMIDAQLVYLSTNFVFDGKAAAAYREYDAPNPISVYGRTKLAGEEIVRAMVPRHFVVRTSWVFGSSSRNFFNSVARWGREREEIPVVSDERGRPTYVLDLAKAIGALISTPAFGTYHLVNEGIGTRFDYAALATELTGGTARLQPMPAEAFEAISPLPARRPKNGELSNVAAAALGIVLRPWQDALREFLCAPS